MSRVKPLTYDEARAKLVEMYGPPGEWALETSDVTSEDCALGIDHVVNCILPALEEELLRHNEEGDE